MIITMISLNSSLYLCLYELENYYVGCLSLGDKNVQCVKSYSYKKISKQINKIVFCCFFYNLLPLKKVFEMLGQLALSVFFLVFQVNLQIKKNAMNTCNFN